MNRNIPNTLLAALCVGLTASSHAETIINPSDDGSINTGPPCPGCPPAIERDFVIVAGYWEGIVIFPTDAITSPIQTASLTLNPYALPIFGRDIDVYGISDSSTEAQMI